MTEGVQMLCNNKLSKREVKFCYYCFMAKLVFGLGNIGEKYEKTRHNAGAIVCEHIVEKVEKVKFLFPETFMNDSGKVARKYIKDKKDLKNFVVVYDDLDIPLGKIKISFDRSSGGHNGLESVIKALKSQEFVRIRIGVAPSTPTGKIKKPKGEDKVLKFLLGDFKKEELAELKKLSKKVGEAIEVIFSEGREKAMSLFN